MFSRKSSAPSPESPAQNPSSQPNGDTLKRCCDSLEQNWISSEVTKIKFVNFHRVLFVKVADCIASMASVCFSFYIPPATLLWIANKKTTTTQNHALALNPIAEE